MSTHLHLTYTAPKHEQSIKLQLPLSKSLEARRLMLLALKGSELDTLLPSSALYAQDLYALHTALKAKQNNEILIDVGESGTAMRFMLAYLSADTTQPSILQGQGRQHQRPIAPLVQALTTLGANISYLDQEGYPPLLIKPSSLQARAITLDASRSSQYLSAMMLIAPLLVGEGSYSLDTRSYGIASRPYALMTMQMMHRAGFAWTELEEGLFHYLGKQPNTEPTTLKEEADWSAASYAYLLALLSYKSGQVTYIHLPKLRPNSLQGDAHMLLNCYKRLGIHSIWSDEGLSISASEFPQGEKEVLQLNCEATPDLVPALVASLVAVGRAFRLTGVHHLRIKESDRLSALQTELRKIGVYLEQDEDSLSWLGGEKPHIQNQDPLILNPHQDHRIAMALAPLMAQSSQAGVIVHNAECVAKSFPNYWEEICNFGYKSRIID